jgi:hypothetical protein
LLTEPLLGQRHVLAQAGLDLAVALAGHGALEPVDVALDLGLAVLGHVAGQALVHAGHREERVEQAAELAHLVLDEAGLEARVVAGHLLDLLPERLELAKASHVGRIELGQGERGLLLERGPLLGRLLLLDPAPEQRRVGAEREPERLDAGTDEERQPRERGEGEEAGAAEQDEVVLVRERAPEQALLSLRRAHGAKGARYHALLTARADLEMMPPHGPTGRCSREIQWPS